MSAYDPHLIEKKIYEFWKRENFFKATSPSSKPPYCIVMPPPNVTGVLHMGHALVNTLQDILTRWKRMSGFETLWLPGTDHAGISTQTVVEKHLMKTVHKTRRDFSRDEFLTHVWEWKEKSQTAILGQLEKLGCSCDWSRTRFTMDEACSKAVRKVFKKMYDDKLIYQGYYLVNWDPISQTALSDDEVEYEEQEGFLWHIRFPFADEESYVTVATTRPETLLGDVAVAVSAKDERYLHLVGKWIHHPLTGRKIPLIQDPFVDPNFGSGAVKITPAHDYNDYEVAMRHHLPLINIMTPEGKINEEGGRFKGLSMLQARSAIVQELKTLQLIEKVEPHKNRIGLSYRSKAIIEPYLSKQWFIRMEPFKESLLSAIKEKRVTLFPSHFEHTYLHWIENVRDWCISRQLWWGHRIPIWYKKNNPEEMICFDGEGAPDEVLKNPEAWIQDEDVLDTWFSSALWPFSTLGWPDTTADLFTFYPTSTLVTGHDILFFWVIRMIMMGEYVMDKPPFSHVFLHGLIYGKSYWRQDLDGNVHYLSSEERTSYELGKPVPPDVHSKWEKMSKSKGNIIDPLEMIDRYGCDATRFTLTSSVTHARQIDLDLRRFEEFKHFINKVWNGSRFVMMHLPSKEVFSEGLLFQTLALEDRYILTMLSQTMAKVDIAMKEYHFDKVANALYDFFWNIFCADYLEIAKPFLFGKMGTEQDKENKQKCLTLVLINTIRLMHPLAPFVTEQLFGELKEFFKDVAAFEYTDPLTSEVLHSLKAEACIVSSFPHLRYIDMEAEKEFTELKEVVSSLRTIRTEMEIPPSMSTDLYIFGESEDPLFLLLKRQSLLLQSLVKLGKISFNEPSLNQLSSHAVVKTIRLSVPLPAALKEKEKIRLSKLIEKKKAQLESLHMKLSNEEFVKKAPPPLVAKFEKEKEELLKAVPELEISLQELDLLRN